MRDFNLKNKDLNAQITFIAELEKLKLISRMNEVMDSSRKENSAEHSWHVGLMSMILSEHSEVNIDQLKVLKMLLIHDIVEIDAGDTWIFDEEAEFQQESKELKASKRIFGLLPKSQSKEYQSLWQEFEERKTDEAKFAKAIDALHPLLNYYLIGNPDDELIIKAESVYKKKEFIKEASESLWSLAQTLIEQSRQKGLYQ